MTVWKQLTLTAKEQPHNTNMVLSKEYSKKEWDKTERLSTCAELRSKKETVTVVKVIVFHLLTPIH